MATIVVIEGNMGRRYWQSGSSWQANSPYAGADCADARKIEGSSSSGPGKPSNASLVPKLQNAQPKTGLVVEVRFVRMGRERHSFPRFEILDLSRPGKEAWRLLNLALKCPLAATPGNDASERKKKTRLPVDDVETLTNSDNAEFFQRIKPSRGLELRLR
jgi:hypothetical protein